MTIASFLRRIADRLDSRREPMSIYFGITQAEAERCLASGWMHGRIGTVSILIPPAPPLRPPRKA